MRTENIGLDLDGVICNIYSTTFKVLKEMYPEQVQTDDFNGIWEEQFDLTQKEIKKCFIECGNRGIFRTAPVYSEAKKVLHRIKYLYNIHIVTWRNYIPNSKNDTLYWLDSNKIPYKRMIMSKSKLSVALKNNFVFFLDDSTELCNRICKTNVPTFRFRRPWNINDSVDASVKDISSWEEIEKILLP